MLVLNRLFKVGVFIFFAMLFPIQVLSADALLLNCNRYDDEQEFQIYINEEEGYVLYNAQTRTSYERELEYTVKDSAEGETELLDDGIDIYLNNEHFIFANNKNSSFVFVKEDASYAYAWTSLVLSEQPGKYTAFGNHHEGKCFINPFNQPKP